MCSIGGGANDAFKEQRRLLNQQRRTEARLEAQADYALRSFDEDWFARREELFRQLGLEAVDEQASDASEALRKAMASRGLSGSSIAARAMGDLAGNVAEARGAAAQNAAAATQRERLALENLRSNLASGARGASAPSDIRGWLAAQSAGMQVPQVNPAIGGAASVLASLAPVLRAEAAGYRGTGFGLFPSSKAWYEVR